MNNYAVVSKMGESWIMTRAEWESKSNDELVNSHTDWCETREEAEKIADSYRS